MAIYASETFGCLQIMHVVTTQKTLLFNTVYGHCHITWKMLTLTVQMLNTSTCFR
jgi:hypothetical protein